MPGTHNGTPATTPDDGADQIPEKMKREGFDEGPIPRVTLMSVSMGVLISMGGFIFGYDTGQISGFLDMQNFLQRFGQLKPDGTYYFTNVRSGLIVAMLSIGTLIGALLGAPIADKFGRKPSISFWCIIFMVGLVIQIVSPTQKWYEIVVGRWVSGLGVGALSLLVPMYQAETAPRHIRGALISTYQLFITFGIFLAACINYGTYQRGDTGEWRIPLGIGFLWATILGFGILLFPETPRFVYRKGKIDEAKRTMIKVYGVPDNHWAVYHELEEIRHKLAEESKSEGYFMEYYHMFYAPRMAWRVALGMALQMFQQLTGATQLILNGINFCTTFYGLYIVEHYGRRKSLIAGSCWMFICFLVFASVGHFVLNNPKDKNQEHSAGIAMICFASFFIFGFATTWGPMIWTICGELYPNRYRAKALALSTASNWLWNFMLAFFTPFITGAIDYRYGYVFAGCNIIGGLLIYFFVIEGKGRTVEQIDTMYIEHVIPWKSKDWIAPPPEELERRSSLRNASFAGNAGPDKGSGVEAIENRV